MTSKAARSASTAKLRAVLAPLRAREEKAATTAAIDGLRRDAKLAADARFRVIRVVLAIEKPERRESVPQRLVEVVLADYTARRVYRAVVDGRGRAVGIEELMYQPPYHLDEVKEAHAIARSDQRFARIARAKGVFASPFVPAAQDGERSRLVGLRYAARAKDRVAQVGSAVVDLTRRELMSFEEMSRS
jgi:hypothetical protein